MINNNFWTNLLSNKKRVRQDGTNNVKPFVVKFTALIIDLINLKYLILLNSHPSIIGSYSG
jgi:hypothetical protein